MEEEVDRLHMSYIREERDGASATGTSAGPFVLEPRDDMLHRTLETGCAGRAVDPSRRENGGQQQQQQQPTVGRFMLHTKV